MRKVPPRAYATMKLLCHGCKFGISNSIIVSLGRKLYSRRQLLAKAAIAASRVAA
jgi:hypothetical protein